ncbi:g7038 [Coccomyxa viridis]|uniref:Gluconokinase n=1 Tax=Coccomyxa viridis TaxID=1274662 RepID=A0ABP1FWT7_9CHLO
MIVMGVCGCGKSTFGRKLATALGCDFIDADEYHPTANVDKMRRGIPLDDTDRWPWLHELASIIDSHLADSKRLVMGCSALKEVYRDILRGRNPDAILFVLLQPSREELLRRLQARTKVGGHFMPASLLDSQLATLEPQGRNLIALQGDGDTEEILTSFLSSAKAR